MSELLTGEALIAILTLTTLEMILGIDNIIFIAILAGRLPPEQRDKGRTFGLLLAVISRVGLVLCIGWVMGLKAKLFSLVGHDFSGRDLILVAGGLFLVFKATREIHHKVRTDSSNAHRCRLLTGFGDYSGRHDVRVEGSDSDYGHINHHICTWDAGLLQGHCGIYRTESGHQGSGTFVSDADRHAAGGGRPGQRFPEGLRLFCNGLFVLCGNAADVDRKEKPSP
jgi:hypothetical protein